MRAIMALWVFAWHAAVMAGFFTRLIPGGGTAVSVFMLLSGLLMTRNFAAREDKEPLKAWSTIRMFWIRRFFRIAPLYFPVLAISLYLSSRYQYDIENLNSVFPPPWSGSIIDPSQHDLTWQNITAHFTFLHGLFPQYAENNIVPDWSLSLEMQFYFVLPFLLLLARRYGFTIIAIASTVIVFASSKYFLHVWPQPSLLPFRMNCFLAGILLGTYHEKRDIETLVLFLAISFYGQQTLFSAFALITFLTMYPPKIGLLGSIGVTIRKALSTPTMRFFGDISYSIYILHMMVLYPVFWLLTRDHGAYLGFNPALRFAILLSSTAVVLIPISYAAYRMIEVPGISLGRRLAKSRKILKYAIATTISSHTT